jgi:predicted nucleic acid-binding protein
MENFMFDTNIFNHILDKQFQVDLIQGKGVYYVTHIQKDEINNTPEVLRKNLLLDIFQTIIDQDISTSSAVFGVSRYGQAKFGGKSIPTEASVWDTSIWDNSKWGDEISLYQPIKEKLDSLNKHKKNNSKDALIAETSIKNRFTLITHDKDLYSVATFFKGSCANLYYLLGK